MLLLKVYRSRAHAASQLIQINFYFVRAYSTVLASSAFPRKILLMCSLQQIKWDMCSMALILQSKWTYLNWSSPVIFGVYILYGQISKKISLAESWKKIFLISKIIVLWIKDGRIFLDRLNLTLQQSHPMSFACWKWLHVCKGFSRIFGI